MSWATPGPTGTDLTGARILVVEDEALVGFELETILADAGAEVVGPAVTLDEGMVAAEHETLTAAILDIRIGGRLVWPLAHELTWRGVPVLFYTGQLDTETIRADWPRATVIAKPAKADTLLAAVSRIARTLPKE